MKIAIVGDPHIEISLSSRLDDYFETALSKIEQIAKENDYVIFLGDVFSTCSLPLLYINRLYTHFSFLQANYNTKFYSIVGNHDISNELESTLPKTSLGTMFNMKLINPILVEQPVIIDNYRFNTTYVKFTKAKKHLKMMEGHYNTEKYTDVLLVHHYFEDHTECFTYDDYKNLGVRYIFMGHEHCPLPKGKLDYPEFTLYRSGSMMRNVAAPYNFERQMYYIQLDTETNNITCKPIICRPAIEIFTQESITRENYNRTKFTESLNKVIEKYTENITVKSTFSIKNILIELNTAQKSIDYIESKYIKIGERFD